MVNGTAVAINYISDGVTTSWAVPFYVFNPNTDLIVQYVAAGVATNVPLNTGWQWSGNPDAYGAYPDGGSVVFQSGQVPPGGATITITRATVKTQLTTWPENNPFAGTVLETALDKLTLIVQELATTGFLGVLAGPPATGVQGQWFLVTPFTPGGAFGYCCVQSGTPGAWNPFGLISQ